MLVGLQLLASNLQGLVEAIMTKILIFWERKTIREVLSKNQIAHRERNKLTSNIYALTLGCIIFLLITAKIILVWISSLNSVANADIILTGTLMYDGDGLLLPSQVDPIISQYSE